MPIGEEVPMLIPVSVILVFFILFLFSIWTNFSEQNKLIRMSEHATVLGNIITNIVFNEKFGTLNESKLNIYGTVKKCNGTSTVNITSNYQLKINITNFDTKQWWCWKNTNLSDERFSVVKTIPVVINDNRNIAYLGKVEISVRE